MDTGILGVLNRDQRLGYTHKNCQPTPDTANRSNTAMILLQSVVETTTLPECKPFN